MTDHLDPDVLACSGDFACLAIDHIEGCFATDTTGYGLSYRIAALLAVARDHARLKAEVDGFPLMAEIRKWREMARDHARLVDENKRLRTEAEAEDDGYDDSWLCGSCGGEWASADDDLTVGLRYVCAGCGEITRATSPRPWEVPDD